MAALATKRKSTKRQPWTPVEEELLSQMIEDKWSNAAMCAAFPSRNSNSVLSKVRSEQIIARLPGRFNAHTPSSLGCAAYETPPRRPNDHAKHLRLITATGFRFGRSALELRGQ